MGHGGFFVCRDFLFSVQPGNPSVLVHVDLFRGGDLGQARHGEDIAGHFLLTNNGGLSILLLQYKNRVRPKGGWCTLPEGGDTYADYLDVSSWFDHHFDQDLQGKKRQPPLGQVTVVIVFN